MTDKIKKVIITTSALAAVGAITLAGVLIGQGIKNTTPDKPVDIVDEHTHEWGEWSVVKEATCTETGTKTRQCIVCKELEADVIEMAEHNYAIDTTVEADCLNGGYTTYKCEDCEAVKVGDEVEALGHDYVVISELKATETENGYILYSCSRCGEASTKILEKTGHNYELTVVFPTCVDEGYDKYTCSICGDVYVENFKEAKGHTYNEGVKTEATCTENEYTTWTCRVCEDTKVVEKENTAKGHDLEEGKCKNCDYVEQTEDVE